MKTFYFIRPAVRRHANLLLSFLVCTFTTALTYSQTVGDVLEKGHRVSKNDDLYLKLDSTIQFGYKLKKNRPGSPEIDYDFNTDSVLLLTSDEETEVFIQPLNPLHFTINSASKLVPDDINKAEATALESIADIITQAEESSREMARSSEKKTTPENTTRDSIILSWMKAVANSLNSENRMIKRMKTTFDELKALDFQNAVSTRNQFNIIVDSMEVIKTYLDHMNSLIKKLEAEPELLSSESDTGFLLNYVYLDYVYSVREAYNTRVKQYTNLEKAKKLVENAILLAESNNWFIPLKSIHVSKTENSIYTVSIDTNAWNMDENGALTQGIGGKKITRVIVVRKFQLLVPEVSAGVYYTFFKYNTYGTTTDSTGQQFVAEPTVNTMKRFNASVMLNYNFYIPNSQIRPLIQFGGGIQSGIPVLMAGGGLRVGNSNAFAITGGVALTWLRELQTLKVGDPVSGTDEIERDLKYEFSFPLRGYIGIQYNF